ncbi:MAG: methyltransferase domain-containing protein, partial [Acetobacteraceae bacterium]|nr:methyltransferase domain-containing protein [Acetobacteraceae bacterium]
LWLVGSEAEYGYWSRQANGAAIAVVPYVPEAPSREAPASFGSLHVVVGARPSAATLANAAAAADWAAARAIPAGVAEGSGITGLQARQSAGTAPPLGPDSVVLDARAPGSEGVPVPPVLLDALASGAPVVSCAETSLVPRLLAAGAGLLVDEVAAGLDQLAAFKPAQLQAMSEAASQLAREWCDQERAKEALLGALDRALARMRRTEADWMAAQPRARLGGHVLVISDEALNLVDVRVHLPFETLYRRGAIDGYTILRYGEFAYGTCEPAPGLQFDYVWVHRSVDAGTQLLLQVLQRPFVYDVDDNLLVSPSYRSAFPLETIEVARALLRGCAVLSCATLPLFQSLEKRAASRLLPKTVITPNLAHGEPPAPKPGPPQAVVWASSDKPAVTGSRREIERAVRDFCLAHGLRLVCVGLEAPNLLARSGLEIEHVGLLSYTGYLARLRRLAPAILVGPLETQADADTQDFVDAKSDVKVMEARLSGLVGVFSRARPYMESDLAPAVLCDNTYESWLDGLERARELCLRPPPAKTWPATRSAEMLGPLPWVRALAAGRLEHKLAVAEVEDAVRFVRQQQQILLSSRDGFDEGYYLSRHDDVRLAIEQGIVPSGYDHYVHSGFSEGRAARRRPTARTSSDTWWSMLLQSADRLEREVEARDAEIERLRGRVGLRRVQPSRPALPGPARVPEHRPERAHPSIDLVWRPPGAAVEGACPVCDTPGPHPVLLVADGEVLGRCRKCASCFYEHRVVYDYEREKDADVLRQLYLEQNASIYHQTRFLFAVENEAASVLDVGCGFGYPVDVAAKVLDWRAVGVDPSFYAREGAALLKADIRKEYLTEDSVLGPPFGMVMASEVIEHVPDPYAFLALLRRWLEPGGTLVLTTPDSAALEPGIGAGSLIGILALKVHLILFTRESLGAALRRAGFRHVQVESAQDNLVAYASDRPLRFREDAAERHVQAYRRYLEHLVETAEPGCALWNGGAGRLVSLLAGDADLPTLQALFARIGSAWRDRFGIDLARLRLPELIPESAFIAGDPATKPAALAETQPLNLAGVLFNRAVLEYRTPGRTPEGVLRYARPAYLQAVQTRRILQAEDMIDLDLKVTAWRARQLIIDCLAELAPEVEGELLRGLAEPSPGDLHDRVDPSPEALVARIAPWFSRTVQADRFDEARRLEAWMRDLDLLCTATAAEPERKFRGLFTIGVLRLIAQHDPAGALDAFERMAVEARLLVEDRKHGALAREFLRVAEEHIRLAADRLPPEAA